MTRFAAVDLGATFIKSAILDLDSMRLLHVDRVPFPAFKEKLPADFREVDVREIVYRTHDRLDRLRRLEPKCAGIVFCGQMHGLVLANEHGEALSNFISWQDQRSLRPHPDGHGTYFDVLMSRLRKIRLRDLGNELRPSRPVSVLFWLAENGKLPRRTATPASLPDFVVRRVCNSRGRFPPRTEPTLASAHGAYSIETGDWNQAVLSSLGMTSLQWPALVETGHIVGSYPWGSALIPCYTPVGDQQCALLGANLKESELSINIGTGSQVSVLRSKPKFGYHQVRPYFQGQYLHTVTHIPAGRSLNAIVRLLNEFHPDQIRRERDFWSRIDREAAKTRTTDLKVDLSFFPNGFGNCGAIQNIREHNLTVGHLFLAAFQAMADNYHAAALRLPGGARRRKIVFSGGLAVRLKILRTLILKKLAADCRVCSEPEDALQGLLRLASLFSGATPRRAAPLHRPQR